MADYKTVRNQLTAACKAAVKGVNVTSSVRKAPAFPAVIIRPGTPAVTYRQAFCSQVALHNFSVTFMTGQVSEESAQDAVADLISPAGSFVQALNEAFTNGQWARVDQANSQETSSGSGLFATAVINVVIFA
jgi:hypothetical protein